MRLSFGQHLAQKQTQTLAPRMIQSMEILQMPLVELQDRIDQELIENPVLERREADPTLPNEETKSKNEKETKDVEQKELVIDESHHNADDFERLINLDQDNPTFFDDQNRPSANRIQESSDRHADMIANVAEREESLQDHLRSQLSELEISSQLRKMCERIISALHEEDGGWLKVPLEDLLPADADDATHELAEEALATIQQRLEPKGVAARDLKECLMLQLHADIPHYENVRTLILHHLEDLQNNRIPQIQKASGMSMDEIQDAWSELRHLDPRPGRKFGESHAVTVTPELWVETDDDGNYIVKMEEGPARNLYISKYYRQRLANGQATKEEREFIKQKILSAQWLIEAIEQRRATLLKVAQAIVDHQKRFLDEGPQFIEPLKMQQVADKVGVHLTTVSRAVDDKYLETHRGIYPLRQFFTGGTTTDDGEDVSWNRIRVELQKLVDNEDKSKPLSDDELVKLLKQQGITVARRTITKYREKLNIPSSRQRRDWTKT
ncbi:MAG: RNA polymerase factor sigma-54 [Pirellulaceae bacterium]